MRTLLLSLVGLSSTLNLDAQVLNSNEMLPVGGVMTLRPFTAFSIIDTTIQGANVTWDFSALTTAVGLSNLNCVITDPASTPYGADFPTANYSWVESPNTAYRYFHLTSQKMERVGSFAAGILKTYSDAQTEYVFPFQLGSTNSDTWDNDQAFGPGTYDLECIGTGTLILPNGPHPDALMVRVWINEDDLYEFPTYFWYSSTTGAILIQYVVGDDFFVGEQGFYDNGGVAGVEEVQGLELMTWNNPVSDELRMETRTAASGNLSWRVFNTTGQLMRTGMVRAAGGSIDRWSVDTSELPSGMYVLTLGDGVRASSLRFVRQ